MFRSSVGRTLLRLLTVGWLALVPSSLALAEAETHCAVRLEPLGPGTAKGEVLTRPVELGCYATLAEAILVGSLGRVHLAPDVTGPELTQAILDGSGMASAEGADYLIGTEWYNTGYTGSSVSYWATGDCIGQTWGVAYVGATHNDKFESGKGFASCDRNKKFEHADYGGAVRTCLPNCSSYQALNNEVSSLKWLD